MQAATEEISVLVMLILIVCQFDLFLDPSRIYSDRVKGQRNAILNVSISQGRRCFEPLPALVYRKRKSNTHSLHILYKCCVIQFAVFFPAVFGVINQCISK